MPIIAIERYKRHTTEEKWRLIQAGVGVAPRRFSECLSVEEVEALDANLLSRKGVWIFVFKDAEIVHPDAVFRLLGRKMARMIDREVSGE